MYSTPKTKNKFLLRDFTQNSIEKIEEKYNSLYSNGLDLNHTGNKSITPSPNEKKDYNIKLFNEIKKNKKGKEQITNGVLVNLLNIN
jgi:ssDNA-binding replication factor A large subunit